ncbi:MAG: nucleoside triphosphate pyrophosphohydrolase [Alphaproteobacteria bacterium]|nr:nucleoside triphosphate pyrophosphohydrolase [Alphaproteobacteria bacterium]MBU0793583.1 nucleoside triphosphate pyrophosphohydrolase [Alphaproteobacteria bacterium]MBU0874498.1 nucleoside triphosphate pyrophosphohydrolase [Alphaproteobacteria bacterium]MBU1769127.1 nucleoside triphosphate pyrophosphohydrolase [Alphaproteobacteria bacterium]
MTKTPADIAPLQEIMARLRSQDGGCPWDIEQTFATIAPYTIEEAYEVADAIEANDLTALKDELGDLLFQVVFHSQMASEAGIFDLSDVISVICDKMIRRHPHVFAEPGSTSPGWDEIKAAERAGKAADDRSALAGVAVSIPALSRAEKIQKRAARVGFDWDDVEDVRTKILEEIEEIDQAVGHAALEDEIGDLLFAAVNLARHHGVDPETALRRATRKFERRFRAMEASAGADFPGLSLDAKEALWQQVKRTETD